MNLLPPLPPWDGLHPLVVHFPIALLLIAPLLVVAGLLWRAGSRGLLVSAFALMLLGTVAAWVAVGSGEAAGKRAEDRGGPVVERVLDQHEELAETTRNVFTALTIVFAAMLFAPLLTRRTLDRVPSAVLHAAFLAMYGGGLVYLVNTAHQGGRLVHELGVRAEMTPAQASGGMKLEAGGEGGAGGALESNEAGERGGRGERGERAPAGAERGRASVVATPEPATAAPPPGAAETRESGPPAESAEKESGERASR